MQRLTIFDRIVGYIFGRTMDVASATARYADIQREQVSPSVQFLQTDVVPTKTKHRAVLGPAQLF